MRIIERDRRSAARRASDERDRMLDSARHQLRRALDRNARAFDQGFAMAIAAIHCLLEDRNWSIHGYEDCQSMIDLLREKVRRPQEIPVFARGTRDFAEDDTVPLSVPDEPVPVRGKK